MKICREWRREVDEQCREKNVEREELEAVEETSGCPREKKRREAAEKEISGIGSHGGIQQRKTKRATRREQRREQLSKRIPALAGPSMQWPRKGVFQENRKSDTTREKKRDSRMQRLYREK
ncbi:hypothetical protein TGPRC2_290280 [Toxoplasma gondii TgCatPRC2]|uniref:Uncharacterized protein n=4 Tax=Toxoplasma gondii TaxID=5811 RepID=A0A151HJY2_TOXGO|nr:hypothetical protein TGME49_290280 [Toxoplasma gondii ME49]EPT28013.1 hypothetical protein TGME49_290280 [Toxoplasma gondii ME49]KYF45058.1 hypothetical protein TGARI_290280 [Toxoplasma gondii ARI]KYK69624.1 hypothetical protein TGPRC2_290280 [Toxoplasma gondii TgCatPRC2]PIM01593.1 hypothetical protein TGCOUG_290280 [Toxoplasma gondii COUG]|eukprot:XP_002368443.1 hypothetical protein TGME49_290280 [Toxoplasma gondii ME49]